MRYQFALVRGLGLAMAAANLVATGQAATAATTIAADRATIRIVSTACGDANGDAAVTATDAAIALRTGVGGADCPDCTCDVNRSGNVSATDGLLILQFGVGQPVQLDCVACATTTTLPASTTTSTTTTTTLPCKPKDLSGAWSFTVTEISETCNQGLDPPFTTTILLEENTVGDVVILSPKLPNITNLMIQRTACSATISYETPESNGSRLFNGTLFLGPAGDSFAGDLDWQFCFVSCSCGGVERWEATRLP